ncbi:MAG: gluconolactonase [Acidobacteria bacterium]|nr:gluconolactonase [Acidobacteriota bacterium]
MRLKFFALIWPVVAAGAAEYSLGPDSQPREGVPKGVVTKHVLKPGKQFPGVPHNFSLYVPAQYDGAKPTAFMVFLDGSGALGQGVRVPAVLDNLIHKKELPPMIGIFVDPGVLPAIREDAQGRFERCYEYDSLSDRYSSFLVGELIPEVAKTYNLSTNPDDRGIYGVSTGAVGALVAAWHRPDQFRRVLSFIGTYVSMKGGDSFAALIRRSEAKPLRVFLQAGKHDHIAPNQPYGTFYAGSWPINNQVMYEAMQFAGYAVRFELGDEAHNMKHGAAILPDAMRWLWTGPVTVREPAAMGGPDWDPRGKVSSVVSAARPWEKIGSASAMAVGPDGAVYSVRNGKLFKDGVAAGAAPGAVIAVDTNGKVHGSGRTAIAVSAKGVTYFADGAGRRVGWMGADRKPKYVTGVEFAMPSGVALSPDQAMVVVTDAGSRFSWSFQIGADGGLTNGAPFYRLELPESGWMSGVSGAVFDSIGQVYFASAAGIQMCEANGRVAALLHSPGGRVAVAAVAFGGAGFDQLYALTADGTLYRRPVKVKGVSVAKPEKLPRPPL